MLRALQARHDTQLCSSSTQPEPASALAQQLLHYCDTIPAVAHRARCCTVAPAAEQLPALAAAQAAAEQECSSYYTAVTTGPAVAHHACCYTAAPAAGQLPELAAAQAAAEPRPAKHPGRD